MTLSPIAGLGSAIVVVGIIAVGLDKRVQGTAGLQPERQSARAGAASSCSCTSVPFTPDPPCTRVCTEALIVGLSIDRLDKSLDLSTGTWAELKNLKRARTTEPPTGTAGSAGRHWVESFLDSSSGKEFLQGLGTLKSDDLRSLIDEARTKKP